MTDRYTTMPSPVGELLLTTSDRGLTGLYLSPHEGMPRSDECRRDDHALADVVGQLDEYFAGRRTAFSVALAPAGTAFQLRVWEALRTIPYGATISYSGLAAQVGNPRASRAVGSANGRNPIAIIVPCHRVIAADGSLGGYGGGLPRKRILLDLEAAVSADHAEAAEAGPDRGGVDEVGRDPAVLAGAWSGS